MESSGRIIVVFDRKHCQKEVTDIRACFGRNLLSNIIIVCEMFNLGFILSRHPVVGLATACKGFGNSEWGRRIVGLCHCHLDLMLISATDIRNANAINYLKMHLIGARICIVDNIRTASTMRESTGLRVADTLG